MKYKVSDLMKKFRLLAGDTSEDIPEEFLINGLNWAFNSLPNVPKLGRAFSKHYQYNLDANDHYKWPLNGDYRRLTDIPMLNLYSSTGGEPVRLNVCAKSNASFYRDNGIIALKTAGTPKEYTIEQDGDDIYLVIDRPSNVPIIIDYIAYGYPKPVESMDDEVEISAPIENLILNTLHKIFFEESSDLAFAGAFEDMMDNKMIPEVIQMLNKRWGAEPLIILGEE